MGTEAPRAPISVYLLAEHLDGALAAGEDLVARGADWRALAENPGDRWALEQQEAAKKKLNELIDTLRLPSKSRP